MKLYTTNEDYCLLKIRLALSLVGLESELNIELGYAQEDLLKLDSTAKSMLLETKSGTFITQHVSILRYIANEQFEKYLLGTNEIDQSMVDQWLDFSWQDLGIVAIVQ